MADSYWSEENQRLWKRAAESGVEMPAEPPVNDMAGANDEELESERLRRENAKLKALLESIETTEAVAPESPPQETDDGPQKDGLNNERRRVRSDGWPRLPETVAAGLSEDERILIRQHEEELIVVSKLQLDDIQANCHIKPQFAKTYRVLRRDLRQTLIKLRARFAERQAEVSDAYAAGMIRSTDDIIKFKLRKMEGFFAFRWHEPIDNWAGKEGSVIDRAGCCVLLLVVGTALAATFMIGVW